MNQLGQSTQIGRQASSAAVLASLKAMIHDAPDRLVDDAAAGKYFEPARIIGSAEKLQRLALQGAKKVAA